MRCVCALIMKVVIETPTKACTSTTIIGSDGGGHRPASSFSGSRFFARNLLFQYRLTGNPPNSDAGFMIRGYSAPFTSSMGLISGLRGLAALPQALDKQLPLAGGRVDHWVRCNLRQSLERGHRCDCLLLPWISRSRQGSRLECIMDYATTSFRWQKEDLVRR